MFDQGLQEASQLLQDLEEGLLQSSVALYFQGLLFRCEVRNFSSLPNLVLIYHFCHRWCPRFF